MREIPFFFESNKSQLFGVLHSPNEQGPLIKNKYGIVFCAPFAEEKMFSHRIHVNIARKLAREGIACLRFDFMGEGDSEGSFEDSTIHTRLSDISAALNALSSKGEVDHLGLLGTRLGATLATLAASQNKVDTLTLISPIISGKPYMDLCLLSNLSTQMVAYKKIIKDRSQLVADLISGSLVNIDGYLIGKALYEQIIKINLLDVIEIFADRILLITVGKNDKQLFDPSMTRFYENLKNIMPNTTMQNAEEEPFWKDVKIYTEYKRELENILVNWHLCKVDS